MNNNDLLRSHFVYTATVLMSFIPESTDKYEKGVVAMKSKIYLPGVRWWEDAEKKRIDTKLILLARAYEYILIHGQDSGTPLPHVEYYKKRKPKNEKERREKISRTMKGNAKKRRPPHRAALLFRLY